MIAFSCSHCQRELRAKDDMAGRAVKCPGCGQATRIPAPAPAARAGKVQVLDAATPRLAALPRAGQGVVSFVALQS